jgi:hypothetical protein
MGGLVAHTLRGPPIVSFPIDIEPKNVPTPQNAQSTSAFEDLLHNAIAPPFVNYYETWNEWLITNVSTDPYQWPTVWNFARIVRNAATHGYNVNWNNDRAPAISWHHLTYSASDNGRPLIGAELRLGDLLVLMFEMDSELDRLGCPI